MLEFERSPEDKAYERAENTLAETLKDENTQAFLKDFMDPNNF